MSDIWRELEGVREFAISSISEWEQVDGAFQRGIVWKM